jgi:uncharacterized membrane protein
MEPCSLLSALKFKQPVMSDRRLLRSATGSPPLPPLWQALLIWCMGSLLTTESVQSWLTSKTTATQFVSPASWAWIASRFSTTPVFPASEEASVSFFPLLAIVAGAHLATWLLGALAGAWLRGSSWFGELRRWGVYGGAWWCLLGVWDWISIALQMAGAESLVAVWGLVASFWCGGCLAGWLTTGLTVCGAAKPEASEEKFFLVRAWMRGMIAAYVAVFVTMNWRLYFNLLIPHGDSAMYEEHLWNLLHGKGFRSYLDQGLFLGEHIQVVHLGLLPIYVLFPSHLTLEFCESLALALGARPVHGMVRRQAGSSRAGMAAAAAYLLYSPMQFLDIEIDLKTFRPEAFGIPIFLWTLDQLDRRSLRGTALGILGCLTVKEDYALVLAPLGVWIAVAEGRGFFLSGGDSRPDDAADVSGGVAHRRWFIFGMLIAAGSAAYLILATRVVMPWFRSGAEIHYASYFSRFGQTPEEIVRTMATRPSLFLGEFLSTSTFLYFLMMLSPLAFAPLLAPGRLAVGGPLFCILCLNELARDPRHHFHAPLVPIVFWALAGGWPRGVRLLERIAVGKGGDVMSRLIWTSSLAMGLFFSLNPLSLTFWDSGSEWYWEKLYGRSRRAEAFAQISDLVPRSARVASTDFVHPRYTHHERSYDYSGYRRKVSDYEAKVPDDTDYLVIDTQHRYSTLKRPQDVPEYRDHPEEWELLSDGDFIVLKRRR